MPYQLNISPTAQIEIKRLPGHIRRRIRRAISNLQQDARPSESKRLDLTLPEGEPRRLKLERWRIMYAVLEEINVIAIVAVRQRPPYQYHDLPELFRGIN